ncbi:Hypothetical protein D9617_4g000480 [Elsinoe fawcettii]|nr:Hypothetical protein D9617_4g000480 [Elsinoe fawcettii]
MPSLPITILTLLPLATAQLTSRTSISSSSPPAPTPLPSSSPIRPGATTSFIALAANRLAPTWSASLSTISNSSTRYMIACPTGAGSCFGGEPTATLDANGGTYLFQNIISNEKDDTTDYEPPLRGYLGCTNILQGEKVDNATFVGGDDDDGEEGSGTLWEERISSLAAEVPGATRTDGVVGARCTNWWADARGSTIANPGTVVVPAQLSATVVVTAGVEKLAVAEASQTGGSAGGNGTAGTTGQAQVNGTGALSQSQGAAGRVGVGMTEGRGTMGAMLGLAGAVGALAMLL